MAKKKRTLIDEAKTTVGLGVVSGAGLSVLGAVGGTPGMPAGYGGSVIGPASAGIGLLNIGQMARSGLHVAKMMDTGNTKKKKSGNKYIDKII